MKLCFDFIESESLIAEMVSKGFEMNTEIAGVSITLKEGGGLRGNPREL